MADIEVEVWLAGLILIVSILTKILHKLKRSVSRLLTELIVKERSIQTSLEIEIRALEERIKSTDAMEERVPLWNIKASKKDELDNLKKQLDERVQSVQRNFIIALTILIEGFRIAVVVANRSTPVAYFPQNSLWPLEKLLAFPTGLTDTLGVPIWSMACHIVISYTILLMEK